MAAFGAVAVAGHWGSTQRVLSRVSQLLARVRSPRRTAVPKGIGTASGKSSPRHQDRTLVPTAARHRSGLIPFGEELGARSWRSCRSATPSTAAHGYGFPPGPRLAGRLAELAAREQGCCAFLTFTLRPAADVLVLDVTAPPTAAGVLADLFGPRHERPAEEPGEQRGGGRGGAVGLWGAVVAACAVCCPGPLLAEFVERPSSARLSCNGGTAICSYQPLSGSSASRASCTVLRNCSPAHA